MSNRRKPARLILRKQKSGKIYFFICDYDERGIRREFSTGKKAGERKAAEKALADHIAAGYKPNHDSGRDPATIEIAEIIDLYHRDKENSVARPFELASRLERLQKFFGHRPVTALNKRLCGDYAATRSTPQAARRELEDLKAALDDAREQEIINITPTIKLPPKAQPRQRWLTRSEAARILWAAWRYREVQKGHPTGRRSRQHVARFILVGLYTGTRSGSICGAAFTPAIGRGYVNLDEGVFYRRALGAAETNKRQPPVRLPERLLAHMRRWQRRGISLTSVVEFNGKPVGSIRKAFAGAVAEAQLAAPKVTPHALRHTAISWALQGGATMWEVSEFFGVREDIIRVVYGHHSPEQHKNVGNALTRGKRR